jgi:hypothetical protein
MEEVYVPKTFEEKKMQRSLLQFSRKENYETVKKALLKAGREDLIGNGEDCLIWYRQIPSKKDVEREVAKDKKQISTSKPTFKAPSKNSKLPKANGNLKNGKKAKIDFSDNKSSKKSRNSVSSKKAKIKKR